MLNQHGFPVAAVIFHKTGYLIIRVPYQRMTMHLHTITLGKVYQHIGITKDVVIFLWMQITHLHNIAGGQLIKMMCDHILTFNTVIIIKNTEWLIRRRHGHPYGKARLGVKLHIGLYRNRTRATAATYFTTGRGGDAAG